MIEENPPRDSCQSWTAQSTDPREMILNPTGRQSELWASAWDFEEGTSLIFLKSGSPWVLNVEEHI